MFVLINASQNAGEFSVKITKSSHSVKLSRTDVFCMAIKLSSVKESFKFRTELCKYLHNIGVRGFGHTEFEMTDLNVLFRGLMVKLRKFKVVGDNVTHAATSNFDMDAARQKYGWEDMQMPVPMEVEIIIPRARKIVAFADNSKYKPILAEFRRKV